ncbi:MAG: DUF86 domain-containing protein [Acidobacteria bacterium]|nr:DUF86 domain-containing protein [Acidobacteriota bacterium]
MSRDYKLYLQDIFDASENAKQYISGMTFAEFSADKKTIDAVVRNLEIIGEAVKNVPIKRLQTKPKINWKQIAGFRDIIIHQYFKVDLEIVWDILQNRLEELKKAIEEMLAEKSSG